MAYFHALNNSGIGASSEPDPTAFSGATLWVDGTGSSLPGLADGGAVGSTTNWIDRITGSRNFSQATAADRPILHQTGGPNGRSYVSFDSTDVVNFSNTLSTVMSTSAFTIFAVVRPQRNGVSGGPSGVPVVWGGGGQFAILLGSSSGNRFTYFQRASSVNTFLQSTTVYSQNVWYIVEAWYDGTDMHLKVNNDTEVTVAKGNPSLANTPNIGQSGLTSDVAGLYVWNVVVNSTDRGTFRTSLADWFGITIP